jgi:phosphoglycolate phosphatase-like HAD superfamily hydrolase
MRALLAAPPRLVVFDVDGTLQDTFAWWPRVLRRGLALFGAAHDLTVELPDDATACAVIGKRDAEVWAPFLPTTHREHWPQLRAAIVPLECEELHGGTDYLYPGVRDMLSRLRQLGVRVALASNCRRQYFTAVCEGLGLGPLSDWQFCLDSKGVNDKRDMVASALAAADTRSAVMVGDREGDQEAAHAHGLPFIWRRSAYCQLDADATWSGDPDELFAILGLTARAGE